MQQHNNNFYAWNSIRNDLQNIAMLTALNFNNRGYGNGGGNGRGIGRAAAMDGAILRGRSKK